MDKRNNDFDMLIVKQIIFVHNGKMLIRHSEYGGFEVDLSLPMTMYIRNLWINYTIGIEIY